MRYVNPAGAISRTISTGAGQLILDSTAVTGYRPIEAAIALEATGRDSFLYRIEAVDASGVPTGEWEIGVGNLVIEGGVDTALNRPNGQVIASSNAGSQVAFSAGTKWIYIIDDPAAVWDIGRTPSERTDFLLNNVNAYAPWFGVAVSGGTATTVAGEPDHPGILRLNAAAGAGTGYRVQTDSNAFLFNVGGQYFYACLRLQNLTNSTIRLGFHDTATATDAGDGAYFEIPSTGAAVFKAANNAVRTTSATVATLSTGVWYTFLIYVFPNAATAGGAIYTPSGGVLTLSGSTTITTNIPTAAGREFASGIIATSSGSVGICDLDYMAQGQLRPLVR